MTARTLTLTDHVFALIADIKTRLADGGTAPDIKAMAERHKAVPSNIRRDLKRIEAAGLITLDPLTITDFGQTHAALWAGETPTGSNTLPAGDEAPRVGDGLSLIDPKKISPDPNNPRSDADDLWSLASDIDERGLMQPIGARPDPDQPGWYILIWGERRWRAWSLSQSDGKPIPAIIRTDLDNDGERLLAQLAENSQRVDLNPMDDANAFYRATQLGLSTADIARAIGQANPETSGRRYVQQRIKLRELKPADQARLAAGEISVTEARDLVTEKRATDQPTDDAPQVSPNENGVYPDQFTETVWADKKHAHAKIRLAHCDDGGWRFAHDYADSDGGFSGGISRNSPALNSYDNARSEALDQMLWRVLTRGNPNIARTNKQRSAIVQALRDAGAKDTRMETPDLAKPHADDAAAKTPVVNVMWWENAVFDGQAKMTRTDIAGRMKALEGYDALDSDIEIAAAEKAGVITETTRFNGTQRFALLVVDGVVHPNETRASHARKARAGDMHGAGAPAKRELTELPNGSRVAPDFVTLEERSRIEGRDSPATGERRSPDPVADEKTDRPALSPRELTDRQLIHEIAHHVRTGHIKFQAMRVGTDDRARRGDKLAYELFSRVYVQGQKIGTAQGESQQIGIASGGGPLIKLYGGPTQ